MNVCFFRHGVAVERGTAGIAEPDRPLTEEGRKKTLLAARGLRSLKLPLDAVLSSPLPRARETAEIVAKVLGLPKPGFDDRLLPEVRGARLLEILGDTKAKGPIFVGHEPVLSQAVSTLISGSGTAAIDFKKAGMALVEVRKVSTKPEGTLLMLLTPAVLRKLGK